MVNVERNRNRVISRRLGLLAASVVGVAAWSAQGATIALVASDTSGNSSFVTGTNFSNHTTVSPTNDYQTLNFTLRDNAGGQTFAGNSLELDNGGDLRIKASGSVTINDLRGNGGLFDTSQAQATLLGNFTLLGATTTTLNAQAANDTLLVSAPITGTGSLAVAYSGTGTKLTLGGANTYQGGTTINTLLTEVLAASSLGTGNVSVTVGTLQLDGSNAIAGGASFSLAAATTATLNYVGTDTVTGLTLGGTVEPAGVYTAANSGGFLTGTGTITVAPVPEPASLGLLGLGGLSLLARRRRAN